MKAVLVHKVSAHSRTDRSSESTDIECIRTEGESCTCSTRSGSFRTSRSVTSGWASTSSCDATRLRNSRGLRWNRVHALEFDVVLLLSCVPFELVRYRLAARRPYLPAAVGTIGLEVHACHLVCNSSRRARIALIHERSESEGARKRGSFAVSRCRVQRLHALSSIGPRSDRSFTRLVRDANRTHGSGRTGCARWLYLPRRVRKCTARTVRRGGTSPPGRRSPGTSGFRPPRRGRRTYRGDSPSPRRPRPRRTP